MLVLLAPSFEATDEQYALLARATGLVPYDLKTKCKRGAWGVVRALADTEQATRLCRELAELDLPSCLVDSAVSHDPERLIVSVRQLELSQEEVVLHLTERSMSIPYGALTALVRGEVQLGRVAPSGGGSISSATFRAVTATSSELGVFREQTGTAQLDAFAALDLHFSSVLWAARVDARTFDASSLPAGETQVQALDRIADWLAERAGVRVDRSIRVSSLASFTGRHTAPRASRTPSSPSIRPGQPIDEHFDAYSRLVAEAERVLRGRG